MFNVLSALRYKSSRCASIHRRTEGRGYRHLKPPDCGVSRDDRFALSWDLIIILVIKKGLADLSAWTSLHRHRHRHCMCSACAAACVQSFHSDFKEDIAGLKKQCCAFHFLLPAAQCGCCLCWTITYWHKPKQQKAYYTHVIQSMCVCFFIYFLFKPQVQLFSSVHQHRDPRCWNTRGTLGSFCCPRSLNTSHRWPAEGQGANSRQLFLRNFHLFHYFSLRPTKQWAKCVWLHLCSPLRSSCSDVCAWWNWSSRCSLYMFASLSPFSWNSSGKKGIVCKGPSACSAQVKQKECLTACLASSRVCLAFCLPFSPFY